MIFESFDESDYYINTIMSFLNVTKGCKNKFKNVVGPLLTEILNAVPK